MFEAEGWLLNGDAVGCGTEKGTQLCVLVLLPLLPGT